MQSLAFAKSQPQSSNQGAYPRMSNSEFMRVMKFEMVNLQEQGSQLCVLVD